MDDFLSNEENISPIEKLNQIVENSTPEELLRLEDKVYVLRKTCFLNTHFPVIQGSWTIARINPDKTFNIASESENAYESCIPRNRIWTSKELQKQGLEKYSTTATEKMVNLIEEAVYNQTLSPESLRYLEFIKNDKLTDYISDCRKDPKKLNEMLTMLEEVIKKMRKNSQNITIREIIGSSFIIDQLKNLLNEEYQKTELELEIMQQGDSFHAKLPDSIGNYQPANTREQEIGENHARTKNQIELINQLKSSFDKALDDLIIDIAYECDLQITRASKFLSSYQFSFKADSEDPQRQIDLHNHKNTLKNYPVEIRKKLQIFD